MTYAHAALLLKQVLVKLLLLFDLKNYAHSDKNNTIFWKCFQNKGNIGQEIFFNLSDIISQYLRLFLISLSFALHYFLFHSISSVMIWKLFTNSKSLAHYAAEIYCPWLLCLFIWIKLLRAIYFFEFFIIPPWIFA